MRTRRAALLLLTVLAWRAGAQTSAERSAEASRPFAEIERIVRQLAGITGLQPLRKVQHDTMGKDQLQQFLEERIREHVKPEDIRAEELVLKKFGLVPGDFDLKKSTVALITEQAAAFYDFRRKKLFLMDSAPDAMQEAVLVHELAHALADQHFQLEKYLKRAGRNDDGALARMAVMEGQATWLMSEYMAQRLGQSLRENRSLAETMSKMVGAAGGQFPVFDRSPLYIRESLLFPYTKGMVFQQAVVEKLGKAGFTEVFRRPPASTQEVLHPEKYFTRRETKAPPLPEPPGGRSYRKLIDGTVGEFDHAVMLRQFAGEKEAGELAPRWSSARYRLWEHPNSKRTVLAYASTWEQETHAREFFRLYRRILQGKWKSMEVSRETENLVAGRGDDGHFLLRLDGLRVSSLEGLEEAGEAGAAGGR